MKLVHFLESSEYRMCDSEFPGMLWIPIEPLLWIEDESEYSYLEHDLEECGQVCECQPSPDPPLDRIGYIHVHEHVIALSFQSGNMPGEFGFA